MMRAVALLSLLMMSACVGYVEPAPVVVPPPVYVAPVPRVYVPPPVYVVPPPRVYVPQPRPIPMYPRYNPGYYNNPYRRF
jgi:hypothetical protein